MKIAAFNFGTATGPENDVRTHFYILFKRLISLGMIMELCHASSLVRWSKYLGIAAAKFSTGINHWFSLVAQVAWRVDNCMIGVSTSIGQVSRFPLTAAVIKLLAAYWPKGYIAIELQICLKLILTMFFGHSHWYWFDSLCRFTESSFEADLHLYSFFNVIYRFSSISKSTRAIF